MNKKYKITLEGNIGSGKTTLANALFEKMDADYLILEEFEKNPYLSLLYEKADVAFETEMFFLVSRYSQLKNDNQDGLIISDYDMFKNLVFAETTIKNKEELKKFKSIYNILNIKSARSDLIVYLDTSVDTVVNRIKKRNRSMEIKLDKNYLANLNKNYKKYLKDMDNVILIDANEFNVFDEKQLDNLVNKIKKYMEV
ncbi:deoxynucleoside kinase [Geotoga petraea]|uniref:Deoxyguanosine kinase n=1 Tax=Geotoga petraea TaxID=28234 RepID=A0A1G6NPM2_9BACT|nr:deoxynucleoside kinase [Geotoga petraea]SDC69246.1 deoxyguanosine kinase [Geotoga petraea]